MKKALVLASVASMIDQFNMNNIKLLQELDYEVDVVTNFKYGSTTSQYRVDEVRATLESDGVHTIHMPIPRKITDIRGIISSYKAVKRLCNDNKYALMHCHSPIGSVVARLGAKKARKKYGTRVIYTAHGFHFFKGAPLVNWLTLFPVEWGCSFITDVLLTINKEDYVRANKLMHAKEIDYIPGVGIDTAKISAMIIDRVKKRKEIGIPDDCIAIYTVGELNDNKNQEVIVKALGKLDHEKIHFVLCGQGDKKEHLMCVACECGIKDRVHFLGYRSDAIEIGKACDIFVFPSKREGLGLGALEAMAEGLPIITSNVHGIVDYSVNGVSGFTCAPNDVNGFSEAIEKLAYDKNLRERMGKANIESVKRFDASEVMKIMRGIYK